MKARRLFVTGTDTGVGKTQATVWLVRELRQRGLRVGVYKPVCSGAIEQDGKLAWDDIERLSAAIDDAVPRDRICPQSFHAPLAPPIAASLESRTVDESLLLTGATWWDDQADVLLIEGAGGWLSPVSTNWTNADLAQRLEADVLLVAANRLGVINHALLSIDHIRRHCRLKGGLLNQVSPPADNSEVLGIDDSAEINRREIESRGGVELWGTLSHGAQPRLISRGRPVVTDWEGLGLAAVFSSP